MEKERSRRNRTMTLSDEERAFYRARLLFPGSGALAVPDILDRTICADLFGVLDALPLSFVDLLILDPPYNLDKDFGGLRFSRSGDDEYLEYLESWLPRILRTLKADASVYACGDWKSAGSMYLALKGRVTVRNRITWQREKGRGAAANWKASSEDIWFGTMGETYFFDVEAVKQRRKVLAPYRDGGKPKDWEETEAGNYRLTHPGNFWDDISVPYWSMPENTDHPTQKPEKLIAKLVLASCPPGGVVLDPFLGSGTSSVVAKKLGRRYVGIEQGEEYCCLAEKRLAAVDADASIQGYSGGVFWERNTYAAQLASRRREASTPESPT